MIALILWTGARHRPPQTCQAWQAGNMRWVVIITAQDSGRLGHENCRGQLVVVIFYRGH